VGEDALDDWRIQDDGDDLQLAAAVRAMFGPWLDSAIQ
jgi:hypothetical protein